MTKLTDETLMYYADGLLSPAEREQVETAIAADPALRARIQEFLATGKELAGLLQTHVEAPVPQRLLDFVGTQEAPSAARAPLFGRGWLEGGRKAWRTAFIWPASPAFAASVALMVGIGLGWLVRGGGDNGAAIFDGTIRLESAGLFAAEPLQEALGSVRSGSVTPLAVPGSRAMLLKVKMTFRNEARDYCRLYETTAETRERYVGLACHSRGRWTVEFQALAAPSGPGNRAAPASGDAVMNAAVSALIDGNPLTSSEEATAIGSGWTK